MIKHSHNKVQFGDFQTPSDLTDEICGLLKAHGLNPHAVIEPTCGRGSFILSSLKTFDDLQTIIGADINGEYLNELESAITLQKHPADTRIINNDFYTTAWEEIIGSLPEPILAIGNPPWVTSADVKVVSGNNLPNKSNFLNLKGFDALTGKSNFDVSEWMLLRLLDGIGKRKATFAFICKTSVARRILAAVFSKRFPISDASIYSIDAKTHFKVAVDACLFILNTGDERATRCSFHTSLRSAQPAATIGYCDDSLVADSDAYEATKRFQNHGQKFGWRSGVKHDCSSVMELHRAGDHFTNGLDEEIALEDSFVYPMLKSSDLANDRAPDRWMLVPQRHLADDPGIIRAIAPNTWRYLTEHAALLDRRTSRIYLKRPQFSVFGIGAYTFAPWKVAISGFYKTTRFRLVGPQSGKPVVLDDTCYFLPFNTEAEARIVLRLLNSDICQTLLKAFIFWDAKRPVTMDLLNKIDLAALSHAHDVKLPNIFSDQTSSQASPILIR